MKQLPIFRTSLTTGLCWGILGGLSIITVSKLSHNGLLGLLPYVVFLIRSVLTVQLNEPEKKSQKLFLTGLITFIIMSFIMYLFIVFIDNPNAQRIHFAGHLWRIGAMLVIGAASSGLLTFLVTRRL